MLIDSLMPGGAERVAVEVACALDRERFAPFFVVTRLGGPLEDPLRAAGVPVVVLGRRGKGLPVRMLARAHKLLRHADLIHAHMFPSSIWGALLSRTTGVPLVTRDPTWSGVRTVTRTYGYRHWIGPRARAIVCPSPLVAQSIEDEGVPPSKLRLIVNGVPTDAALPRDRARSELGLDQDGWVIGIIANLREEKRHEVLLRAFARLVASGRNPTLCLVGDGPRRPQLEALAHDLGIEREVVWAGDRPDARRLASAFDTAVICSSWEGLPLAALEVMAAGTPLVATRVGVLPRILGDGAGVLVNVDDDEGLAAALVALMDDPSRGAELRAEGLRLIADEYRFERMVDEFAALYDDVLAR
jgi:glycosyltransferase involved in cell wall biosynthesis